MIGYLVSRRVFDREPIRISCIELSIMNQKANMKKLYVILIMLGGLSAQNSILKQFSDQFADIAEKANPAVVTILTEKKIDLSQSHRNLPQDNDLFRFFFNQPRQREFRSNALGSGVIVDARKGYILTNNHVVEEMDEITIRLLDKTEYEATIIGRDPKSDLSLIHISEPTRPY